MTSGEERKETRYLRSTEQGKGKPRSTEKRLSPQSSMGTTVSYIHSCVRTKTCRMRSLSGREGQGNGGQGQGSEKETDALGNVEEAQPVEGEAREKVREGATYSS